MLLARFSQKRHLIKFFSHSVSLLVLGLTGGVALGGGEPQVMPLFPEALQIEGVTTEMDLIDPSLRTGGVTHVLGQDTLAENVSTLELDFNFSFELAGKRMVEIGFVCGSGCRATSATPDLQVVNGDKETFLELPVVIYRFAKDGRYEMKDGTGVDWLVRMVDGDTLKGFLRLPVSENGTAQYPGELVLDGKMVITLQADGEEPVNLLSETSSVQTGRVDQWPPSGTSLSINQPVAYYDATFFAPREARNAGGGRQMKLLTKNLEPTLLIDANSAELRSEPSPFLSILPHLKQAVALSNTNQNPPQFSPWQSGATGGVGLEWRDSASSVNALDVCQVDRYHVYRNDQPGNLDGWRFLTQVPANQTHFVDPSWNGMRDAEYMIIHAGEMRFGHVFEGSPGRPLLVRAVQ